MENTSKTPRQDKINGTIARVEKRIAKLEAMTEAEILKKYGYGDPSKVTAEENLRHANYWHSCDVNSAKEQLANNIRKLDEAKRLDERAVAQKAKKEAKIVTLENAPQVLKDFAKSWENRWYDYYSNPKVRKENHDWRSLEEIRTDCRKDAEWLVIDFMGRTAKKCGKLTDCQGLHLNSANIGITINGFVVGEKGTAYVESILAGGYNIQCLHVRVLIK